MPGISFRVNAVRCTPCRNNRSFDMHYPEPQCIIITEFAEFDLRESKFLSLQGQRVNREEAPRRPRRLHDRDQRSVQAEVDRGVPEVRHFGGKVQGETIIIKFLSRRNLTIAFSEDQV